MIQSPLIKRAAVERVANTQKAREEALIAHVLVGAATPVAKVMVVAALRKVANERREKNMK